MQDGPEVLAKHFNEAWLDGLLSNVQLVVVGAQGTVMALEKRALTVPRLQMRSHVLYNHLDLRNCLGKLSKVRLPSVQDVEIMLASWNARLAARARYVENDAVEGIRKPSDIADVRDVATSSDDEAMCTCEHTEVGGADQVPVEVLLDPVGVFAGTHDPVTGSVFDGMRAILRDTEELDVHDRREETQAPDLLHVSEIADSRQPEHQQEAHVRKCTREEKPVNEFTDNAIIIYGAFWCLFPLGQGLHSKGSVPVQDARRLVTQFHNRFAKQPNLLFLLANQMQRHAAAR